MIPEQSVQPEWGLIYEANINQIFFLRDSPFTSNRWALTANLSIMASAIVYSPMYPYHFEDEISDVKILQPTQTCNIGQAENCIVSWVMIEYDQYLGSVKWKLLPLPASLSAQISPLCFSMNSLQSTNPSPVPFSFKVPGTE